MRTVLLAAGVACALLARPAGSLAVAGAGRAQGSAAARRPLRLRGGRRSDQTLQEEGPSAGTEQNQGQDGGLRRADTAPACLDVADFDTGRHHHALIDSDGSARYAWDAQRSTWLLFKRPDEDLSVESLRGKWDFPPSDCLTFRHRVPNKWQHVDFPAGVWGWVEFIFYITPGLNQLLYAWQGLYPCAVCGRARSQHPCKREEDATAAFWQAVRFRDVALAVRLIRGGVSCDPGDANWCVYGVQGLGFRVRVPVRSRASVLSLSLSLSLTHTHTHIHTHTHTHTHTHAHTHIHTHTHTHRTFNL